MADSESAAVSTDTAGIAARLNAMPADSVEIGSAGFDALDAMGLRE